MALFDIYAPPDYKYKFQQPRYFQPHNFFQNTLLNLGGFKNTGERNEFGKVFGQALDIYNPAFGAAYSLGGDAILNGMAKRQYAKTTQENLRTTSQKDIGRLETGVGVGLGAVGAVIGNPELVGKGIGLTTSGIGQSSSGNYDISNQKNQGEQFYFEDGGEMKKPKPTRQPQNGDGDYSGDAPIAKKLQVLPSRRVPTETDYPLDPRFGHRDKNFEYGHGVYDWQERLADGGKPQEDISMIDKKTGTKVGEISYNERVIGVDDDKIIQRLIEAGDDTKLGKFMRKLVAKHDANDKVTYNQGGEVKNPAGIVGGYNITDYATDPNHESKVATYYKNLSGITTPAELDKAIKQYAPQSPLTGQMIFDAAKRTGSDPLMIASLVAVDSSWGTKGKGARTNNPGNVGNTDTGAEVNYGTFDKGLDAVGSWLSSHATAAAKPIAPAQEIVKPASQQAGMNITFPSLGGGKTKPTNTSGGTTPANDYFSNMFLNEGKAPATKSTWTGKQDAPLTGTIIKNTKGDYKGGNDVKWDGNQWVSLDNGKPYANQQYATNTYESYDPESDLSKVIYPADRGNNNTPTTPVNQYLQGMGFPSNQNQNPETSPEDWKNILAGLPKQLQWDVAPFKRESADPQSEISPLASKVNSGAPISLGRESSPPLTNTLGSTQGVPDSSPKFNAGNFASSVFDSIGGANGIYDIGKFVTGLIGANQKLPTWKIPQDWTDYTRMTRARANEGLSAAERANYYNQLENNYVTDVTNFRNNSSGNSAFFAGNEGAAINRRNAGALPVEALDAQIRRENLGQYGDAAYRGVGFDRQLFEDKYNYAMMNKQAASGIAAQGLQGLFDETQNYQYTKPGSAYGNLMKSQTDYYNRLNNIDWSKWRPV